MDSVSVNQDTMVTNVTIHVLQAILELIVMVYVIVVEPTLYVIHLLVIVYVILDGWVIIVSSLVHRDVLVRTALYSVTVIYMEHVTLWVVYASVTQDGSYLLVLKNVIQEHMDLTVHFIVSVITSRVIV